MSEIRKRHFTFLELIIAVSIMALIAMGLYAYSSGITRSWAQLLDSRNRINEMLNLDRAVDKALANMVPFIWRDDDYEEFPFIVAEANGLRFAYLHPIHDSEEGAIRFAEFLLEEGNLYLMYTDRPFYNWDQVGDRKQRVLLAEEVAELNFSYVDWDADSDSDWNQRMLWTDLWETSESGRMDIPLGVLMRVRWQDGRTECWMRRTLGNSYRERYGKWNPYDSDAPSSTTGGWL